MGAKVKPDPCTYVVSFKKGIKMFNTEWVLEGFEQNKSHQLSGELPQRIWEIQSFKLWIQRSGRSSVKETKCGLDFFPLVCFLVFWSLYILMIISGKSLG